MFKINQYAIDNSLDEINLNLGSGGRPINGWINIDNYDYEKADTSRSGSVYDIKMDIRKLDVKDESVDKILLVHVIEHFVRWETLQMIDHFHKKLKPQGLLIVEMPDLHKCIQWYLKGKDAPHMATPIGPINMGRSQFYGNQWNELDYETHRYVWDIDEFCQELVKFGFKLVQANHNAVFHKKDRDMFVVAAKS